MRYALLMCTDESAAVGDQERARRAPALDSFTGQMAARGKFKQGAVAVPPG